MKCPYCGYKESRVVDSRPADEGSSIRRRRECLACEKRFTTYETMESLPMVVIKKDGSRQSDKFKAVLEANSARPTPKWLDVDAGKMETRVLELPSREDIDFDVAEHLIVELYSK